MTSRFTTRPFAGDQDFEELFTFVSDINSIAPPHTFWHIGDMMWNTCFANEDDRRRIIRLWHRDGALQGFAWFDAPGEIITFVHPALRGTGPLEREMFEWAATLVDRAAQPDGPMLQTISIESDSAYNAYLASVGFQRGELYMYHLTQALDAPILAPALSDGWVVRPVGGEDEWTARVDIHRDVWHPSKITLEKYRRLRALPRFILDLDIVAVAPDGTFAAYTGGWLDRGNAIGLFEPVGTREPYRRQGLSAAVLTEGLRRMQAHGARAAWVSTNAENTAALATYHKVGFRGESSYRYRRPL